MGRRQNLHDELASLLGSDHVYYQPPQNFQMKYPCIIYSLSPGDTLHADNSLYRYVDRYTVTHISRKPDDNLAKNLLSVFEKSRYVRRFVSDNLYHDIYEIYY